MEMEVTNGYALDDTVDSQTSQASTTSGSSLAIQFSVDELQENSAQLPAPSSSEAIRNEGKTRRLNRRLALANLQLPKLSVKEDSVIDLCTEEDRAEDLAWFKKKFPNLKTDEANAKHNGLTSPPKNPKNQQFPHSDLVATQRALKQDLEKKLAKRRKAEMAKRREQYMEDNEGLLEDEEEEIDTKDSIKPKKRVKKPVGSDDDSENDEDYNGDDEEEEEIDESGSECDASGENDENGMEESADELDESKVSKTNDDLPESVDLFDGLSTTGSVNKDSDHHKDDSPCWVSKNEDGGFKKPTVCQTQEKETTGRKLHPVESLNLMLNESFDAETPPISQPTFPNSLSQWFGDKPSDEGSGQETEEVLASEQKPEFVNIGSFSDMDPFKDAGVDDMLMLCSGRFDTQNLTRDDVAAVGDNSETKASDDEDEIHKSTSQLQKRKRKLVTSDDEDEIDDSAAKTANLVKEKDDAEAATEEAELAGEETESLTHLRRAVIDSDSDENTEEQEEVDKESKTVENETVLVEELEEDEDEEMEEVEGEEDRGSETEKKTKDYIEEEAEDSDDELAVIRRLEKKEFERKANRENWFDDEASLSGDDVGSDVDEDGDVANEYEAEEGDADNLPDTEAIRRQNHRLLLKQEQEREHKALVKLQDRLLADGDLGGTETNRTFRLKLREEVTMVEGEEGETEVVEEEEASSSQAHAQRVSAIKWLIEHKEEYEKLEEKDEDDIFDVATRSVKISEVTVNVVSKAPRTLLGQSGLENAIKELAGTTTAKQLYMNNANAALKRPPSPSAAFNAAKKMRSSVSVLSVLEQQ